MRMSLLWMAVWLLLWAFPLMGEEKSRLAVLDLEARGASEVEAEAITEEMRRIFVKTGRYIVIDRTLTSQILKEWETQQSGVTDEGKAIQIGKLFNVTNIVTGKLHKFPGGGWQVSAVMLDAQSGETKRAETVRHRGDFFSLLDEKIPFLGNALASVEDPGSQVAVKSSPPVEAEPPPKSQAQPPRKRIAIFPARFEGQYESDGIKYNHYAINGIHRRVLHNNEMEITESYNPSRPDSEVTTQFEYLSENSWEGFFSKDPNDQFIFKAGKELNMDYVYLYKVSIPGCRGEIEMYLYDIGSLRKLSHSRKWKCRSKGGKSWVYRAAEGFDKLLGEL